MSAIPPCAAPDHPPEIPRDQKMVVVQEDAERVVFACVPCRDKRRILSVQVRTLPRGVARARYTNELRGVERMKAVKKLGKIVYFT